MENIDWTPPEPRSGLAGEWDKFVGPGATSAEEWVQLGGGLALTAMLAGLIYWRHGDLGWTWLQVGAAVLFALDLIGGVLTNATTAAKRWYHRAGQTGLRAHLPFVAVHGVHLVVIVGLFGSWDWVYVGVNYAYLLIATVIISAVPLSLQRTVGFGLFCGGVFIGLYGFVPVAGLEWFLPLFYFKLLVSHLLKEAPFAPHQA